MFEMNKANTVAFHKRPVFEGDVETAFRMYAGAFYRQHGPLIEDGVEGPADPGDGSEQQHNVLIR
jgi:predicted SnoaL-like aldol condensation-catalyzing enzyme